MMFRVVNGVEVADVNLSKKFVEKRVILMSHFIRVRHVVEFLFHVFDKHFSLIKDVVRFFVV